MSLHCKGTIYRQKHSKDRRNGRQTETYTNIVKLYMYNLKQASYLSGMWSLYFCGIPTLTLWLENLGLWLRLLAQNQTPTLTLGVIVWHTDYVLNNDLREILNSSNKRPNRRSTTRLSVQYMPRVGVSLNRDADSGPKPGLWGLRLRLHTPDTYSTTGRK